MVLPHAALMPGEIQQLNATRTLSDDESSMVKSLLKIDQVLTQQAQQAQQRPAITIRVLGGITDHFKLRVSEWFATALLIQFGLILYGPEQVFPHAPNFAVLATWASEQTWGLICLILGGIHWAALTINGTFPRFKYSPHVRAISSFLACYLWFQITLGIAMSGQGGTGLGTYRLVLLLELWNFIRACQDVGKTEARRAINGS